MSGNKIFFSAENNDGTELFVYNPINLSNKKFAIYNLKVYPNPTNEILKIDYVFSEKADYTIYDLTGKKIAQDQIINNEISLNIENGIYLLKIETENQVVTHRIIKN